MCGSKNSRKLKIRGPKVSPENLAEQVDIALAWFLASGIALLTVSWKSWKEATRNPVEALRYE